MAEQNTSRRDLVRTAVTGAAALLLVERRAGAAETGGIFDVKTFGAAGDGKTLDTQAVNKAIDAAAAAGGGTVHFPAGSYLCYSIHLRSNVALDIGRGAKLVAADSPARGVNAPGYDAPEPNQWDKFQDFGHSHWHNSLLWGEGLENVSILGPGLIWGKGLSKGTGPGPNASQPGVGNKTIALKNCRNVLLRDFAVLHGGHFAILATGVDNFTIDNLTLDTNRDGMDIDCCRNVRVSNCTINSPWDDAICLKSSYGLGSAKPTETVTITNCYVSGCWEEGSLLDATYKRIGPGYQANFTGRIKFGTESNGGFKNITISNCVFEGCQGLALETVDGALLEDVTITNITMRDVVSTPIFLRLGNRMRGPEGMAVGSLRRVIIDNVVSSNSAARYSCIISGIPGHPIEDVKLTNLFFQHRGGGSAQDAAIQVPEKENAYPEPGMFGATPSHGFFVRHVKGIEFGNVELRPMKDDLRPAFVFEDVQDVSLARIRTPQAASVPAFVLKNVRDFTVQESRPVPDTHLDSADDRKL